MQHLGFIFDWDGVVIDSHAQHEESWGLLFDELGRDMPEDFFKRTFGMRNQQIIPEWFDFVDASDLETIARLGGRKEELYRDILRRDGLQALPGVHDLLEELQNLGIPAAVGSSTPRVNIDFVMDMIGLSGMFTASVTAEDVTAGKPDPQVFLKAAEGIQREPKNCIVFEDAYVGIEAGKRAGMKVVGVATTHPRHTLTDADVALPNLDGVTVSSLLGALGIQR
ncbi:beta-phosphoglucomutase [Roseimicrobium gellanilyticum]|uniref:Beta-phosphoglucomutase n=1 Tax=Roseimicrobium gellanilyticum TaxID=748857 RepID=A0A366HNC8_9BACT|nr:HAD family phosphatase [Roseimicrobium gellanilyticum]RBP43731.1 beta-phosphoglucomutase [Roseimicrobium gellanilyticum]